MGKAHIGTSGYSYLHWVGVFYPKGMGQGRWLEHYAKSFDTVELNITFYRLVQEALFLGWFKRTPKNFIFSIKGSRFITHIKRLKNCNAPLKLFFSRARLLKDKLGPILWQLPPSYKANPKALQRFLKVLKKYKNIRHVLEFRNRTWFYKKIFSMLKDENIALCSADWPEFCKDAPLTANFLYIRRHGQGAHLYGGCYTSQQLKKDAGVIKKNLKAERDVYIYFNNDAHGYAVKNALALKKILGQS